MINLSEANLGPKRIVIIVRSNLKVKPYHSYHLVGFYLTFDQLF